MFLKVCEKYLLEQVKTFANTFSLEYMVAFRETTVVAMTF